MAGFLNTIGLVSGALGIIQFAKDNFPGQEGPSGAMVSVKAGLAANLTQPGGGIDTVYAYDYDNQYLGSGSGGNVADGGLFTTTIDQGAPDTQADFVGITFTDDAVCVAWIMVQMNDGSPSGAWTGDIGSACGEVCYTQTQTAGTIENVGPYIPRCTWFDADHTAGEHSSMKFRTRAYGKDSAAVIENVGVCGSTIYGVDPTPLNEAPTRRRKRDTTIRPQWMKDELIVSSITQHSSQELCNSTTSWGPDFIDTHGNYCDMSTKTLSPLCSTKDVVGCIKVDGKNLNKRTIVNKRDVVLSDKTYKKVTHW